MNNDKLKNLTHQYVASTASWIRFLENTEKDWGLVGIDTGIHDLNLAIGGIMPSEVITVAARSGVGKTALITPILKASTRYVNEKPEFLFFTWEMSPDKLVDRMISYDTGLSARDLIIGARLLSKEDIERVKNSIEESKKISVSYHVCSTDISEVIETFNQFKNECSEKEKKDGIPRHPIGIIDYVGLAELDGSGVRTYGINDFYRGLKQCSNSTGGSWLVLAQISRSADRKESPDREDLADSQSIENNSDVLLILHRPEYVGQMSVKNPKNNEELPAKGKMLFKVLKCRQFGPSSFVTNCDISKYRFWSLNHDLDLKYWEMYKEESFWKKHFGYENKPKLIDKEIKNQKNMFDE